MAYYCYFSGRSKNEDVKWDKPVQSRGKQRHSFEGKVCSEIPCGKSQSTVVSYGITLAGQENFPEQVEEEVYKQWMF